MTMKTQRRKRKASIINTDEVIVEYKFAGVTYLTQEAANAARDAHKESVARENLLNEFKKVTVADPVRFGLTNRATAKAFASVVESATKNAPSRFIQMLTHLATGLSAALSSTALLQSAVPTAVPTTAPKKRRGRPQKSEAKESNTAALPKKKRTASRAPKKTSDASVKGEAPKKRGRKPKSTVPDPGPPPTPGAPALPDGFFSRESAPQQS